MTRRGERKAKPLIEDSDKEEEEGRVNVAAAAGEGESGEDDAEANADLGLQVSEWAMRRCGVVLNGSLGASPGGGVRGLAGNLAASSTVDTFGVGSGEVKGTMKKKKKKKKKLKIRKDDAGVPALIKEDNAEAAVNAADVAGLVVVEVPDNLELRKLLRGPRYFDPPTSGWATCYNCGEEGHMAVNCTAKKKRKPCFVCGSLDHHGMQCAKSLECFICKKAGQCARDCSDKPPEDQKLCLKCGESGHDMFSCGDDYRPDDLKEIQCYICKTRGHLCCVNSVNINETVISCFKCGEWGHDGLACTSGEQSAHVCQFKNKSTKAMKRRAAKAKKKLAESKASSVQPHKREKKASPKTAPPAVVKTRKMKKTRMDEGTNSTPQKSTGGWITADPGDTSLRENKKKSSPKTQPPAVVKTSKRKKSRVDEGTNSTPQKSRGGWNTEDPGDTSRSKMEKYDWNSPSTPSSKPCTYNSGAQSFQGSEGGYQQQYSGSRFGYYGGMHYSPGQMLRTPGSYGHLARTYGHYDSMYDHHNSYDQSGSTYGHYNTYDQSSSRYGHHNTYDQSGGMCGDHNTYGPSGSQYGHHNTYGYSGGMHGHYNTYGHSSRMYGDHNTHGHSGGAYGDPSSSYAPARTYGNVHGYPSSSYDPARAYGNVHGYSSSSYDPA